jgi:hypothetical protein
MNMKQYNITVKVWTQLAAESPEEAKRAAKNIVDEALYYYVNIVRKEKGVSMSISKAKTVWVKESQPHEA